MLGGFSAYPTALVFLAVVLAAAFTLFFTPGLIKLLRRDKIGQQVRDDGPQTHLVKQGTPTMGGIVMLLAAALSVLVLSGWNERVIALLVATLVTGAFGFIDDYTKVVKQRSLGLTPKAKLIGQFVIAAAFCLYAVNCLGVHPTITFPLLCTLDLGIVTTVLPGGIQIPWLYLVFVLVLMVGMCNAVNLTDGLDGLAGGTIMVVMLVFSAIAYRNNQLEVAIFAGALAGACIGFLWFNAYPADIFMGDTGSLALGMALGCLAVVTDTEVVSLVMGGLFVVEALSVMIQVLHYKRTKKRLFLMAPLHHHFEKKGWSEVKVVIRFWIVSGTLSAIGFLLYFVNSLVVAGAA